MAHNAGAAYILYAQGLLPFLLPLSVLLIEPAEHRRRRMLAFTALGALLAVFMSYVIANLRCAVLFRISQPCSARIPESCRLAGRHGDTALCLHVDMVRVRRCRQRNYLLLFSPDPRDAASRLFARLVNGVPRAC